MVKVYTGIKGFALIAGLVLFFAIFFWGITTVVGLLFPLLMVAAYLLIIIFIFGFLPATFLKSLRPSLGMYAVLMSHALGAISWLVSFCFIVKVFGLLGIFFIFLFQLLAPIAILGALFKGSWHVAGHLLIWTAFIYAMRFYSRWLLNLNSGPRKKGNIIDIEANEV